eukprot:TRINITY_DN4507_c0_g2_i5.p2 TRINITY_DN4507_c0_g2~~TRINITY_DN4507_c0_g2_i5.p2  ORF type:complete len:168 (-),score=9.43 TRINITY_DN4507_c0_g2_i5:467-970(-)
MRVMRSLTYSSDSPLKTKRWPSGVPLSISSSNVFASSTTVFPLHFLHLSLMVFPLPPHSSQAEIVCLIMKPIFTTFATRPVPEHTVHSAIDSSLPPFPPHSLQIRLRTTFTFFLMPVYTSASVSSMSCRMDLVFLGPCGALPCLKRNSKGLLESGMPPSRPSSPYSS